MDSFLLITSSIGLNFWTGHHAGASGGDDMPANSPLNEYGPRTEEGVEVAISGGGDQ